MTEIGARGHLAIAGRSHAVHGRPDVMMIRGRIAKYVGLRLELPEAAGPVANPEGISQLQPGVGEGRATPGAQS